MGSFCDFGWVRACHIYAANHVKYFTMYLNENCNFKYSCYLVMDWIIPKLNFEPSQTPPKSQNFEPVQKILTKIKSL